MREQSQFSDEVVLLDDAGLPVGTAPRATVHGRTTPLHLAFSCYVYRPDGLLLLTRRALSKRSWPGVWTNSVCGHPRPGETVEAAIDRHADRELGIDLHDVAVVLPDFRYTAVDAAGVMENERCPVYVAATANEPEPARDEVLEIAWVDPAALRLAVAATPFAFSPWLVAQVEQAGGVPAPAGAAGTHRPVDAGSRR